MSCWQRLPGGDGAAFGCFYRRHERRVLAYAVGHCIGASDVADLVAETFLQALASAGRFRTTDGDALPWLLGISRHVLARQRRSFIRRQRLLDRLSAVPAFAPDEADAVDAAIDAARLAPALTTALSGLSAKDRELLLLVARDGLDPGQAGAVLGMTPNAARVRLSRVRKRLQVSSPTCPCRTRARRCPMLTINRQPPLPELRQFSQEMEAFLVAAADARTVRRPGRVRGYVAAIAAAAVVVVAVVVGLARSQGPGPNPNPSPGPVQLASFEVSTAPGGLVKLTLSPGQLRDPGALRQALAKVSVPALVTVGKICYVPGPSAILTQVLSSPPQHLPDGKTVWTIAPSAIPKGKELSIGYYHVAAGFGIHVTLVPDHAVLTCTASPPTPPHP